MPRHRSRTVRPSSGTHSLWFSWVIYLTRDIRLISHLMIIFLERLAATPDNLSAYWLRVTSEIDHGASAGMVIGILNAICDY